MHRNRTLRANMATLAEQVEALNQAIADGVRSVTIGGQTTIYNTTDSLMRARDDAQTRLNAQNARAEPQSTKQRGRTYLHYAGRGYSE